MQRNDNPGKETITICSDFKPTGRDAKIQNSLNIDLWFSLKNYYHCFY